MTKYSYFLIIGGTRCGTTALMNYLQTPNERLIPLIGSQHPFGGLVDFLNNVWIPEKSFEWHKEFNKKALKGRKDLIYFTRFFVWNHPKAPEKMYKTFPDAKIIMMMRNPVHRAFSKYTANKTGNRWETLPFEKAIERPFDENNEIDIQMYNYKQGSYWLQHLKKWQEFYPKKQIMTIHSESFFRRPGFVIVDVQNFLNINPIILQDKYEAINAHSYREIMKDEIREKLHEHFKPYNEALYEYLGIDFGWEND